MKAGGVCGVFKSKCLLTPSISGGDGLSHDFCFLAIGNTEALIQREPRNLAPACPLPANRQKAGLPGCDGAC